MALSDRVTERYRDDTTLVQLTQHDDNLSTVDTTVLGYAADDVEGWFLSELGFAYDETRKEHVAVAVQGVVLTLRTWHSTANPDDDQRLEDWRKGTLRGLRRRLGAKTSSELTPSDENPTGGTVRPRFDRPDFNDFVPGNRGNAWPNRD